MDLQSISRFLLKQRITPLVNRYEYFSLTSEDKAGERVAFVEQKRFTFKEEITAWSSEDRAEVVLRLKAEKVLDVHGRYWVMDAAGAKLGYLRKAFGRSLLRSTWEVYDADDRLLVTVQETSQLVALVRRFGGIVPVIGEFLQLLPFHFQFLADGQVVGSYNRLFSLRDEYSLSLEPAMADVDRRLMLAMGIALDALQSR